MLGLFDFFFHFPVFQLTVVCCFHSCRVDINVPLIVKVTRNEKTQTKSQILH